jgi:regulator of sigma E protease
MTLDGFLWYAAAFVVALGVLIVVHEFGHFAVARAVGVKVLRFSVGFGQPLLSRRWGRDGTEWVLAAFPLGGYVKMLDEREGEVAPEELDRAFNRQSVIRRSLIVVAGPLANLLLAVLLYWGVYLQGVEELRPVIGMPPAATLAARSGIEAEETVRAVAGIPVATWQDVRWEVLRRAADRVTTELETINRRGEINYRRLDLSELDTSVLERDPMKEIGLLPYRPLVRAVIGRVMPGSRAEIAGIRADDEILDVAGKPVQQWADLAKAIREAPEQALTFGTRRGSTELQIAVVPEGVNEGGRQIGRIGIAAPEVRRDDLFVIVQLGPIDALQRAVSQTWNTSVFTLRMIGRMLTGELSWKNVSGPVTIADYAGQSARMGGMHYLRFLALISISLGVLNLLPIPILDGGHLMYYLAEVIKGGPLSERVMEVGQQIGLALLILLMAFAFYNDINRLISG